jgi:ABC-type sugar transport system ATPase subunit
MSGGNMEEQVPALEGRQVSKAFGKNLVLDKVDFDIRPGEIHALIGENGAGKSTVLKILFGIYQPGSGSIYQGGKEIFLHNPMDARNRGIAMIHQEPLAFNDMSVFENIILGNINHTRLGFYDRQDLYRKTEKVLDRLGLSLKPEQKMLGVSVAEQQLVEIGASLMSDAGIIFMDEPTASLTPDEVEKLFAIIHKLKDKGKSIVYVSHRLDEIKCLADRITVLKDGKKVGTWEGSSLSRQEMIRLMIGCSVQEFIKKDETPHIKECHLKVDNISIPGIFSDVSFEVRKGEILGFFGLMGSGRTEVARALFGITPVKSGQISLGGKPIKINSPRDAIKNRIALVPEDRQDLGVLLKQGIDFNATFSIPSRITGPFGWVKRKAEKQAATEFVDLLKTKYASISQPVGDLSGGNQQKVSLGKWLATYPDVLILDEPTRGIDVGAKAEVYKIINQLALEGKCIIMISSEVEEVVGLSDRVVVMYEGRQTAILDRKQISEVNALTAAHDQVLGEGVC